MSVHRPDPSADLGVTGFVLGVTGFRPWAEAAASEYNRRSMVHSPDPSADLGVTGFVLGVTGF
jgi:hypothetical protein